ncbi:MAG: NAD(P)H-dependent oxidoreductase subunit E, partial [Cyclobacteriaceae bacterium]|nr:NAD(P)H-dependent oxidoreductase subunit E [Cyclobacteriaceae bacterium]
MKEGNNILVDDFLQDYKGGKSALVPLLQTIQEHYNYLPDDVLKEVCKKTEITPGDIMGVASFYSQFRLKPTGEHIIKVCMGTACHVKRAKLVHDAMTRELHLEEGQETDDTGKFTLEKVNCVGSCTLAPVVQIDETTYGHVDGQDANKILKYFDADKKQKQSGGEQVENGTEFEGEVRIALDSCCVASGTEEVMNSVKAAVKESELNVKMKKVGCVGMCHQVPLIEVRPNGKDPVFYSKVRPEDVKQIMNKHFRPQGLWQKLKTQVYNFIEEYQNDQTWEGIEKYHLDVSESHVTSFMGRQAPIATEYLGTLDPLDISEYKLHHGFRGLKAALTSHTPDEVVEKIKKSGLRGRGGGGFPTGLKWEMLKKQDNEIKYVIVNGDEGDPGAFMDRMLLESYPFRVIEGLIIAAYATQATNGYFYIRAEYPKATKRIAEALNTCREHGYLGENIMDSGFSFDIKLFRGAGAFICGEETALIASIEGDRGFPSLRPPYPVQ